MRAKVILSALLLALIVVGSAIYVRTKSSQPAPVAAPVASVETTNAAPAAAPPIHRRIAAMDQAPVSAASAPENPAADLKSPDHEEYVTERKAELYRLGISQDPASLRSILADVQNPDPQIRQAAVTATMDFDSKEAIPALQQQLAWAEDPEEKAQIQQAINFLQLPSFELDENGALTQQPSGSSPAGN